MTTATTTSELTTAPTLTVSDLARGSGVAPSAVRFYEKHGLITSERTPGNQRRFHQVDECIVKIIRVAQRVGLSVAEIRGLMADLPGDRGQVGIDDFRRLRLRLEAELRQRMDALAEVLDDLTSDEKLCELPPKPPLTSGRRARSFG
ncbi:MAG TPA: MerR family DNA-binding transcriptional regulator [Pseudonocardiaceae bacterium]|jgi:MerR family redox-sensitive transcriptional activator SoxR|nr:MerR family DNA-binding transcriptional regulator [Pseudonocardiaceae bacterium]